MNLSAWRVALRIARRDALRAKGRSALVIAMIAVPVLGVATVDITYRSAHLSHQQAADRRMGTASALVESASLGRPLMQAVDPDKGYTEGDPAKAAPGASAQGRPNAAELLKQALPPGATTVPAGQGSFARLSTAYGVASAELLGLDLSDPVYRGMLVLRAGTVPKAPFEVAATTEFLSESGLALGGTTTVAGSSQPLKITAEIELPGSLRESYVVGSAQDINAVLPEQSRSDVSSWLVSLPGGAAFSWDEVLRANTYGFTVASRAVLADPPPDSAVPYSRQAGPRSSGVGTGAITVAATVVGMALLEIVLLAGPAFAVGARRSRRQLGLLAASGGDRSHVRNVVLGGGVVLGTVGALVGIVVAAACVAIGRGALEHLVGSRFGSFTMQPLDLLGIVAVGLVTGLLAAVVPALQASRQNVLASLTGRGDVKAPSRRLTLVGAVLVLAGTALALLGAGVGQQAAAIMGGSMIAEIGLVACIPFLVGQFGRVSRWLPLTPRLALRDSTRHRGRTAPAVAAVMAAVAGAIAVTAYQGSRDAENLAEYQAGAPRNAVVLQIDRSGPYGSSSPNAAANLDGQRAAVEQSIPGLGQRGDVSTLIEPGADCVGKNRCSYLSLTMPTSHQCPLDLADANGHLSASFTSAQARRTATTDPRCLAARTHLSYSVVGTVAVGDAVALHNLTGASDPAAVRALAEGKVLVGDPRYIENGRVDIVVTVSANMTDGDGSTPDTTRKISAPAVAYTSPMATDLTLMSPETAQALKLTVLPVGSVWLPGTMPSSADEQRANAAVGRIGAGQISVERGYQDNGNAVAVVLALIASVVAVAAAGIATGLAAADSQADLATLAAVGAAPRIRRTLSGFQCAVIALMGAILGAAAGLVPAAALWGVHSGSTGMQYTASDGIVSLSPPGAPLDVPWSTMALVVVGLPLLSWLLAAGFTRSRMVLTRRLG